LGVKLWRNQIINFHLAVHDKSSVPHRWITRIEKENRPRSQSIICPKEIYRDVDNFERPIFPVKEFVEEEFQGFEFKVSSFKFTTYTDIKTLEYSFSAIKSE
jgi:hypothetical protein